MTDPCIIKNSIFSERINVSFLFFSSVQKYFLKKDRNLKSLCAKLVSQDPPRTSQ